MVGQLSYYGKIPDILDWIRFSFWEHRQNPQNRQNPPTLTTHQMTDIRGSYVPIGLEADTIGHSHYTICRWKFKTGFCSNCMLNEPQLCYLCYFELVCWIKNIYVWNHWQVTEIKCVISTFFPLVPNLFAWFLLCSSSTSFRLFGLCFRSYPTALKSIILNKDVATLTNLKASRNIFSMKRT